MFFPETWVNTYTIKWNLKWSDNSYLNDDEICTLGLKVLLDNDEFLVINDDLIDDLLVSANPFNYNSTTLTKENFTSMSAINNYAEFIFTINLPALKDYLDQLGRSLKWSWGHSEEYCRWNYFFPTVEYKDRGTLYLDYIEISDDLYDEMTTDPNNTIITSIENRSEDINIENIEDNLYAFETFDEPLPPYFDAYKIVEDAIDSGVESQKAITAVNSYGWDSWDDSGGNPVNSYYNADLFDLLALPEIISPDYYLYSNQTWRWNNLTGYQYNIQRCINRITRYYFRMKTEVIGNDVNRKPFLPIVQTWGDWDFDYIGGGFVGRWDNIMLPPDEQQKMLLFLPLCYAADGLFTFRMTANVDINGLGDEGADEDYYHGGFGLIDGPLTNRPQTKIIGTIVRDGDTWIRQDQYFAVKEANEEVKPLGYELKSKEWLGAGTIETNTHYPELEFTPNLPVSITVDDDDENYYGFIECGEYKDSDDYHYFMLVNRRTNYVNDQVGDGNQRYYFDVNSSFYTASSQYLTFTFSNTLYNSYVLIDQYTGDIYDIDNLESEAIPIEPGDGMLLKICQLPVPQIINNFISISNCYIPYDVTVQNGGTLNITGNVEFGPNASLSIEEGGQSYIWGENLFGENSKILVGGTLQVNCVFPVTTILSSKFYSWQGIECLDGGVVNLQNEAVIENALIGILSDGGEIHVIESTISNCNCGISLQNRVGVPVNTSTLEFDNSSIEVPDDVDAVGINVNPIAEYDILITGNEDPLTSSIQGLGVGSGTGIFVHSLIDDPENQMIIEYTTFENLNEGIHIESSVDNDDEITYCNFNNCSKGLSLNGSGSMEQVRYCEFSSNSTAIQLNSLKVPISDCDFTADSNNDYGIELNYVSEDPSDLPDPGIGSINNCEFTGGIRSIICNNGTPRITNCIFSSSSGWEVDIYNKSCIDMSWNSNNLFSNNHLFHIKFEDSGLVNLLNGHNDFYDTGGSGPNGDFWFHNNYEETDNTINCNGNYWSDRIPGEGVPYEEYIDFLYDNIPEEMIVADFGRMDDDPNCLTIGEATTRYEEAEELDYDGNSSAALILYSSILTDQLETEKMDWKNSIDRMFSLTLKLGHSLNSLISFYDSFILSIPSFVENDERDQLIRFVENYQKKAEIELKNYQNAADIVVERIDDPITSVDSLFAVMELENIYYLASLENGRSNISTSYQQHNPQDCKQLQTWRDDHWNEINELLGLNDENENAIIPVIPKLYNNYPNPFNPETTISFSIPEECKVTISIFNIKGQKVTTLLNDEMEKGKHEVIWKSKDNSGKSVASGVYFYKLDVNGKNKGMKKMLLLK